MIKTNKNFCTIYLVRHGETDWNIKGFVQGQSDIPLNQKGEQQAKELADQLKNIHFDAIYSSDLMRAKRTAEIIAQEKKLAILTTKILRERDFGDFEGKKADFLIAWRKSLKKGIENLTQEEKELLRNKNPNIESDESLMQRFIPFIREIAVGYPGKNILIITHGSMMRTFLIRIGFFENQEKSYRYRLKNGSYVVILSDGVEFFVKETWGIEKVS